MAAYLRTDPTFADQFSDVWLWQDWPGRAGKHDTGIDLVANDRVTANLVAVQCKFYDPAGTIAKPDVDSFLAASGKAGFAERIICVDHRTMERERGGRDPRPTDPGATD